MHRRKKKLVSPPIQLRLVGTLVGVSVVAMMLQFLFLGTRLITELNQLEGDVGELTGQVPRILLEVFAFSLGILVPVLFAVGITATFRVAGPLHRFKMYLQAVARGEEKAPCKLRKGDHLQDLCDVINEVTEPLRKPEHEQGHEQEHEPSQTQPPRAA